MSKPMEGNNKPLVPKLRFPEFLGTGLWASIELASEQVSEFVKDKVAVGDIHLDNYVSTENMLSDFGGVVKATKKPLSGSCTAYSTGDVLVANIRPYLNKVWFATKSGGASNDVIVIRPLRVHSTLLAYMLKSRAFISYVMRGAKGVKMPRGDIALMKRYPVAFPATTNEQQKIADCLTSIDELTQTTGARIDALNAHKNGLMQQLFPRDGDTMPRLRFPEFRDAEEWEKTTLKTKVELVSGQHLAPGEYSEDGEIPYFTGPSDYSEDIALVSKWTARSSNTGRGGDTLITVKGSGVGELLYLEIEEVAMGRQLMAVRPRNSDGRFVFYYLSTQRQRLIEFAMGNLIPGLSRGDILGLPLGVPDLEEQQKIADCLSSLDDLITATSAKRDALKQHKKGLMQQLFPVLDEADA